MLQSISYDEMRLPHYYTDQENKMVSTITNKLEEKKRKQRSAKSSKGWQKLQQSPTHTFSLVACMASPCSIGNTSIPSGLCRDRLECKKTRETNATIAKRKQIKRFNTDCKKARVKVVSSSMTAGTGEQCVQAGLPWLVPEINPSIENVMNPLFNYLYRIFTCTSSAMQWLVTSACPCTILLRTNHLRTHPLQVRYLPSQTKKIPKMLGNYVHTKSLKTIPYHLFFIFLPWAVTEAAFSA